MRLLLTILLVTASAVVTGISVAALPYYNDKSNALEPLVLLTAGLWLLFALAVIALRKVPTRQAIAVVIAGALAIGGAALLGPPNTSTDSARYAWDGIVQNAGLSPYEYVPADPALEELRTDWLFPAPVTDENEEPDCVGARVMTTTEVGTGEVLCTTINRATVPTIYPPTSELFFAGVRALTGPDPQYAPMQVAGLLMSLAITAILLHTLHRTGRDPRWAALWAWSPLAATEGITNSHIDILGALLLLAATVLVASGRRVVGAIALGASIATKLIPVIGAPALLGRRPWALIGVSIITFLVLYIPYILTSGIGVLGYLPGYLSEEGYESGTRFIMLSPLAPGASALIVAAVLVAVAGILVWWKTDPTNPYLGQVVMIGVTLLIVTPRYPWYALLLVPMIAMTGRWEWLAVPLALTERLLISDVVLARFSVGAAIILIVGMSLYRYRLNRATTSAPRRYT
ncbi:MAG TPA: glycosyltransferase family 87 protein [Glaciihabitans sp.]|nr:glycosyltransferase family 87 protein [Glaciihabitans sp.]